MKALVLIIIGAVLAYIAWQVAPKAWREEVTRTVKTHGPRLGGIIAVILLIAAAAYFLPVPFIL